MTPTAVDSPSRPQSKMPTSMRYERVQNLLESDKALCSRLGPKTCPVPTRFGEQLFFSKEAVQVTEALHNEGLDAHKAPKQVVFRTAIRLLRVLSPASGEGAAQTFLSTPILPAQPASPVEAPKPKPKVRRKKSEAADAPSPPPPPPPSPTPRRARKPAVAARRPAAPAETAPPEPPKTESPKAAPARVEEPQPVSELPPEKQPLSLPDDFDPTKYPHYSVQSSIYSMLLSALSMAEHYERLVGSEERQKRLDELVRDYLRTCDAIKIRASNGHANL
jgi:hypothetical protein